MDFPLYRHGTRCLRQSARVGIRSMPCLLVTVGFPARITGYPLRGSVRPASWPADSFLPGQRVAFHAVAVARLSSTLARCNCDRHVFVPRNDCVLRCVKYTCAVQGCQAKMFLRMRRVSRKSHASLHNSIAGQAKGKGPMHIFTWTTRLAHHILLQGLPPIITAYGTSLIV